MSVRECGRCDAISKTQNRCKRRICKTFPCCWQHLKTIYGLAVKESQIPNAGLGLFTTKDIIRRSSKSPRNDVKIVKYTGEVLSSVQLNQRYGDELADYTFRINKNKYLDARSTQTNVARYANGCDNPHQPLECNARLTSSGWLVATKSIKAGSEILTPYHISYWTPD